LERPFGVSQDPRFEPLPQDGGIFDRMTGLVWERAPGPTPLTWAEATGGSVAWRLPTIGELSGLAAALTPAHPFEPSDPRGLFWSISKSPFTRQGSLRGVAFEGDGRFVVVLLDPSARARRWRVRTSQAGQSGPRIQTWRLR
jgi:hypothetical protein